MSLPLMGTVVWARAPGEPKSAITNVPAAKIVAAPKHNLGLFVMKTKIRRSGAGLKGFFCPPSYEPPICGT
jgi:hypothetical protein